MAGSPNENHASVARPADALYRDIQSYTALPAHVTPQDAATAVVCVLSRRISRGEARDVLEWLPPDLRPHVGECALNRGERAERFDRDAFLERVGAHLSLDVERAAPIARAVFAAVQTRLPSPEINDVATQLPSDLAELWKHARTAAPAPP